MYNNTTVIQPYILRDQSIISYKRAQSRSRYITVYAAIIPKEINLNFATRKMPALVWVTAKSISNKKSLK